MHKRALFLLFWACSAAAPVRAAGYGTASALLMAEGLSVQPLGQAGAWTARAEGEAGQRSNPAGLAAQQGFSLGGGQVLGLLDDRISWLDLGLALAPGWGLGLQAAYAGAQDTARDAFGNDLGTFTDRQWLAGLALGGELAPGWGLGLSLKGLQEDNGGSQALALAGDLGLQGPLGGGRRFGLALLNAGSQLSTPGLPTPLRLQAGASTPVFSRLLQAEADVQDLPHEGQARLLLGAELGFDLDGAGDAGAAPLHGSLRLGGQFGLLFSEDPAYSLGAGVGTAGGWDVDYALQSVGSLGLTHRLSLTLRFGAHAAPAARGPLTAPYGLQVERRFDGLVVRWQDDNRAVAGYNLYSDYGVLVDRLTPQPVPGRQQKFVRVTPSRTYNFYVRAVGLDGKEGPPSDVLMWVAP